MAVKDISHYVNGEVIERVPVAHKVALGLPRGYVGRAGQTPLNAPRKLFSFLVQTRDDDGAWKYDKALATRLFGDSDDARQKPKEIKIQLIGSQVDDMVYSDLFYWSMQEGAKCSAKTMKPYMRQWCEDNNIPWEEPLSSVKTFVELKMLFEGQKINERMSGFIDIAKNKVNDFKEIVGEYDIDETDIVTSIVAIRKPDGKGPRTPYPCTFMNCPDYIKGDCKYNGRFFFIFDGDDMGEVVTLVTTSPKNIQNIQWGLKNLIGKVLEGRTSVDSGNPLTLHGIPCRLVGRTEKGMYSDNTGQHSTQFFIVSLMGPADSMMASAKIILDKSKEISKMYPGGFRVKFDEGDEIQLAKERINEYSEGDGNVVTVPKGGSKDNFKVGNETIQQKGGGKKKGVVFSKEIKELLKKTKKIKKDEELVYMINEFTKAIDKVVETNGKQLLVAAFRIAVVGETITVKNILKSQSNFNKFGSKINFVNKHKTFIKSKKERK